MGKRRRSRELAVQVLFHLDINGGEGDEALDLIMLHFGAARGLAKFARELVAGVIEHAAEIDHLIRDASEHWRLERLPLVDKGILRVAVFEMGWRDDVPARVSIDEAVEIGKIFGGDDTPAFINGVLDKIFATLAASGRLAGNSAAGGPDA
jgi:transcription antitermination factor NusB